MTTFYAATLREAEEELVGAAIDFEHAEWRAITLQNHIHRTADAMFYQQFGSTKSLLLFEMIGNYGLSRAQGITCGRGQVRPDGGVPDDALVPADTRANQKPFLGRDVFHHFAILRSQTFGRYSRGVIEHFGETSAL